MDVVATFFVFSCSGFLGLKDDGVNLDFGSDFVGEVFAGRSVGVAVCHVEVIGVDQHDLLQEEGCDLIQDTRSVDTKVGEGHWCGPGD